MTVPVEYETKKEFIAFWAEAGNVTLNPSQVELTGNEENINKVNVPTSASAMRRLTTGPFTGKLHPGGCWQQTLGC